MTQTEIQWRRLGGIVAMQGSITLAWVIYALYLPDLLVQLGFARQLAGTLLIIEHALEVLIEPIFGNLSDQSQQKIGTRFPWISLGVILASAFFLALPIIAFVVPPASAWRWIFPFIAVFWASAMAIFRSPVISLLRQATPEPKLPIAASCLTLVQQLVKAFRFTAYGFVLSFGPLFTFATGSFVILGAAALLRRVTPPTTPQLESKSLSPISSWSLVTIVGTGVSIGWSLRFLFASLSQIFATQLSQDQVGWGMLGFSLLVALTAIPAGKIASQFGNSRVMFAGLVATAILLVITATTTSIIILLPGMILMSFAFSSVLNGMVPFVLELIPAVRSGLGIGAYFGAFGGAISFFDLFFAQFSTLGLQASLGVIAFLIASFWIAISRKFSK